MRIPSVAGDCHCQQQQNLDHLEHKNRHCLGQQESPAWQRRATEPFQDAIVALVRRGDAEVHHASRDDRQGENPRYEEVQRTTAGRRDQAERREEDKQNDRNDNRDQHVLAAPGGKRELHARLRQDRPPARHSHSRSSLPVSRRNTSSSDPCPTRSSRGTIPCARSQPASSTSKSSAASVWTTYWPGRCSRILFAEGSPASAEMSSTSETVSQTSLPASPPVRSAGVPSAMSCPPSMIATRSARRSASSIRWVVRITVTPCSFSERTISQVA